MSALKPKILYVVTEDWYFCSHRLPIACAARDAGFEVVVATRVQEHRERILKEGFRLVPIGIKRSSRNFLYELKSIFELFNLYRLECPDIVHHVALKPVIYGSFAARAAGITSVINAVTGLGYVFSSNDKKARLLRPFIKSLFHFVFNLKNSKVIVQNPDDAKIMSGPISVPPERVHLIPGSGVDIQAFSAVPEPDGCITVTMVSRMLKDKGVAELAEASRILRQRGVKCRILLVGQPDPENPSSISAKQLSEWSAEGLIEWQGHRDDIPSVWAGSHIAVLPSYREGLPKSLLEAAACGRPIITTDTPGCREIVKNNQNGLLVKVRDHLSLADAIQTLVENPELRTLMGAKSRELAVSEFSTETIVKDTMRLYKGLSI